MTEADRFLEARRNPPPVPTDTHSSSDGSRAMRQESGMGSTVEQTVPGWFALDGRIGRQTYFIRMLLIGLGGMVATWLIALWHGTTLAISLPESTDLSSLVAASSIHIYLFVGFIAQAFIIPQETKRLHDLNLSGWYQLLFCIPILGALFHLYVLFHPGTAGPNGYGGQPH